jgi:hypothetical protein
MKTAIIFCDGVKQINFTPENDDERTALKMITPNDDIDLAVKEGTFSEKRESWSPTISTTRGGYLRAFEGKDAIMLVMTPKDPDLSPENTPMNYALDLWDWAHEMKDADSFIDKANKTYKISKR